MAVILQLLRPPPHFLTFSSPKPMTTSSRLPIATRLSTLTLSYKANDDANFPQLSNELAVMPQDRVATLEWDRRFLSVLGVENKRPYELRLRAPENVFVEEESDLREVMDSFRVNKVSV
ncbi:PsbP, C-terminal [Dillenia turbinata]|uniref:PsbP, C-terminal n=1 Tax=Dillenia turbinata TaxID=194707 RepID=A0AAN8UMU4_9MAGN